MFVVEKRSSSRYVRRRRTFIVDERTFLALSGVYGTGVLFTGVLLGPDLRPNPQFFGRTDLSTSRSRPRFDQQADFEVRSAVAAPKPCQIGKNRNFRSKIFAEQIFFGVEKRNVQNRLKRVLAKFGADPSQV